MPNLRQIEYLVAVDDTLNFRRAAELQRRSIYRTIGMAWRKSSAGQSSYHRLADFIRDTVAGEFSDMTAHER